MRRAGLVLVVLSFLAACGDGGGRASTPATAATTSESGTTSTVGATSTAVSTTTTQAAVPAGRWRELLGVVPGGGEMAASIIINDYEAARGLLGLAVPSDDASEEEVVEYLLALQQGPVAEDALEERWPRMGIADDSFGLQAPYDLAAWRTAYGIGIVDVDRTIVAGIPPGQLIVWQGRIDPAGVGDAVASDPEWRGDLRTVEYGGVGYYVWGDDPAAVNPSRVGPVRPLGQGGCLYATDGLAARANMCAVLEAAIDAGSGAGEALADLDPVALLADALQRAGAYAAFLTLDVGVLAATNLSPSGAVASGGGLLPYLAAATGAALDGDGAVTVIALVHGTAEDAAENAARLERVVEERSSAVSGLPWSDLLTVLDIAVDGELVVARLATEGPGNFWLRLVTQRDSLLAWE